MIFSSWNVAGPLNDSEKNKLRSAVKKHLDDYREALKRNGVDDDAKFNSVVDGVTKSMQADGSGRDYLAGRYSDEQMDITVKDVYHRMLPKQQAHSVDYQAAMYG